MTALQIALLGQFQVTLVTDEGGRQARGFRSSRAQALLAYLAVEGERAHRRESLMALLWPEEPESVARTNLRTALFNLRQAIGDGDASPPFLLVTTETLRFNPASEHTLDVSSFTSALAETRTHPHAALATCRHCMGLLEGAVERYRGDFLAGFSLPDCVQFEEWAATHRERLLRQALNALDVLSAFHERRGEAERALGYARRHLELDPWHEETHRQVMRLLARQGKREGSLGQYETCRRVLAEELGLEPSAETEELAERIRAGEFAATTGEAGVARQYNLTAPTTSLLGREVELAQLTSLLATTGVRLVTLMGPPGIGKTRLAQEVAAQQADDYVDGVCYVELAPLRDPGLVLPTIAASLGVQDRGGQPLHESLHAYLREKQMLLVLDNFEHVLSAAAVVAALLGAASQLQVLATSRAALRVAGEQEFPVPPLAVPDAHLLTDGITDPGVFASYTAVQLFVERAHAIQPGFALTAANGRAMGSICARLDGLPLAIELAAARTRMLPPQALLGKLSQRLKVLTGGPRERDPRQQTLRNTIEWSYDLLSDGEKQLFRRMAVFQGGRTLDALEAVCNFDGQLGIDVLEGVESLISQSLLQQRVGPDGEPRFWLLETIHEYAWEKLRERGEAEALRREHAQYFVRLAEEAKLPLNGPNQAQWFARFGEEHDNLRAALDWAYFGGEAGDIPALEAGLQLLCSLREYWDRRGHGSEGRRHLARLLALAEQHGSSPVIRAESLDIAGVLALWHGDYAAARALLEEGLALGRAAAHDGIVARCLYDLGYVPFLEGDYAGARSLFDQSLTLQQKSGDLWGISVALMGLGIVEYSQGDYAVARTLLEQCLALQREIGDKAVYADALGLVGNVAYLQGDFAEARALHEESLVLRRELGVTNNIHLALSNLGNVACSQGNYAEAREYFQQCLALSRELGDQRLFAMSLRGLGAVAACTGQPKRAAQLLGAATELISAIGGVIEADDRVLYDQGIATARARLGEAAFQRTWEEGRAMSMKEAIEYAMLES